MKKSTIEATDHLARACLHARAARVYTLSISLATALCGCIGEGFPVDEGSSDLGVGPAPLRDMAADQGRDRDTRQDAVVDANQHHPADGGVVDTFTQNDALPDDAAPSDALANDVLPNDAVPNDALANDVLPNDAVPNDAVPNDALLDEPLCPVTVPSARSTCDQSRNPRCSYGTDPRPGCRIHASCRNGLWGVAIPRCAPLSTAACPSAEPTEGTGCQDLTVLCDYLQTSCFCRCEPGQQCDGRGRRWECYAPPSDGRCPRVTPNLGQPCAPENLDCRYGAAGNGTAAHRVCRGGVWTEY